MTDTGIARWEQYNEAARRSFGQGNLPEAEEYFQAAIREAEVIGAESPQLASSLNALGQLRLQAKDLVGAEEYLGRALAIREKIYGPEHHALVSSLNNIGALHDAKGELDSADAALRRALAICEQQLQPSHPDLALALNNLSRLCFKRRDFSQADRFLLRLLEIKRALGKDHPEVATVLGALGRLRHAVGRHDQAEQLWRQALAIRERAFAPNDPLIATTLESLADCCAPQAGRIGDAIAHRERALAIRVAAGNAGEPVLAAARRKLEELKARASGDLRGEPAAPPPPPRSSRELPSPVTAEDAASYTPGRASGGNELPWLDAGPSAGERVSQPIELASVEQQFAAPPQRPPQPPPAPSAPPPLQITHAAPPPFAAPPPPARELAIDEGFAPPPPRAPEPVRSVSAPPPRRSSPRPVPMETTGPRAAIREEYDEPRPRGRWLRRIVMTLVLAVLATGGWVAYVRGYVHPLALLSAAFETVARHAPSPGGGDSVAPAPRRSQEAVPDIVVPESLVSASTDSAARDTVPDDGLHPKVKVDIAGVPAGASQLDSLSTAIDQTTKAKLDSAERARPAVKQPAPARP